MHGLREINHEMRARAAAKQAAVTHQFIPGRNPAATPCKGFGEPIDTDAPLYQIMLVIKHADHEHTEVVEVETDYSRAVQHVREFLDRTSAEHVTSARIVALDADGTERTLSTFQNFGNKTRLETRLASIGSQLVAQVAAGNIEAGLAFRAFESLTRMVSRLSLAPLAQAAQQVEAAVQVADPVADEREENTFVEGPIEVVGDVDKQAEFETFANAGSDVDSDSSWAGCGGSTFDIETNPPRRAPRFHVPNWQ